MDDDKSLSLIFSYYAEGFVGIDSGCLMHIVVGDNLGILQRMYVVLLIYRRRVLWFTIFVRVVGAYYMSKCLAIFFRGP